MFETYIRKKKIFKNPQTYTKLSVLADKEYADFYSTAHHIVNKSHDIK